jgi:hypothetical protein
VWLDFLGRNKAKVGSIFLVVAAFMQGGGATAQRWATLVAAVGGIVAGGGMMKDDHTVRTKQAWEAAGQPERRR